ncbi:MAG: cytochrome [Phycisphaerales bacterium]|nr:cytochrome [Phycisphaerales bacterium]
MVKSVMARSFSLATVVICICQCLAAGSAVAASDQGDLDGRFRATVQPFLQTYCVSCHGSEKPKGDLDLSPFTSLGAVTKDFPRWELVHERLAAGDMPPAKAKQHPDAQLRREVVDWVEAVRREEARRNAGDPGPVFARRLSNAEYDYTIRDLTGVDIRPTAEFPVDPANEAGFDNSSESLAMSPALLKKYIDAARRVSEHLVLKPDGLSFAPYPVVAETDRDKYCVRQIIDFYQRQPTDYADYFVAAWRYEHRAALGKPSAALADVAGETKVSAKYLTTVWSVLNEGPQEVGPVAALQAMFRELPAPDGARQPEGVRTGCEQMRDFVVGLRGKLTPEVKNLPAPGINAGSQTLVLWKDRQMAANRRRYAGGALTLQASGLAPGSAAARAMTVPEDKDAAQQYEATFHQFCSVFPDAFLVSERARVFLDAASEKKSGLTGRLLSAGFHNQMGYFRDDGPLYELVLDDNGQRELDRLWHEFDFITGSPVRQHSGFIWYERAESGFLRDTDFDFARAEDKDAASEAKIQRLAEVYLAKAKRLGANETALEAVADYFHRISASIRWVEQAQAAAEPRHVEALQALAERAYRRPLREAERADVAAFYRSLRKEDGLTHEEAVRDTLVRILMSPHFSYRVNQAIAGDEAVRPLSDYSLANRLSYFLWSSMPDQELLGLAARGELHRPDVLIAQARRMLRDDRARALSTEFAGNWLEFRRFEEHNSVDRERFKSFTNELRRAMFEEPVRFITDIVRSDGSVLDCLYADYTFVNPVLARHYGMPEPAGGPDQWTRVAGAARYGRGGLLPMAVFLTKNSPGLRTSPVKRGYWVTRRVLGERIPPPPADVPQLPGDETKLGELTLRETLARHRENKSCAVCHDRFDSVGLVFEGYGPVGELRAKDFGGRPVDTHAVFPGGGEGAGLAGLRDYIRGHREQDFVDNLCRKLLAYGLGRTLLPSDDDTLQQMRTKLAADGYRFGTLVESIVTSPQFLKTRVDAAAITGPAKENKP